MVLTYLREQKIATTYEKKEHLAFQVISTSVLMLELHEQVELHWGLRRATSCHWLSAVAVLEEYLEGIVLSTVAAVPVLAVGNR